MGIVDGRGDDEEIIASSTAMVMMEGVRLSQIIFITDIFVREKADD